MQKRLGDSKFWKIKQKGKKTHTNKVKGHKRDDKTKDKGKKSGGDQEVGEISGRKSQK